MQLSRFAFVLCILTGCISAAQESDSQLEWEFQASHCDSSLRGLCVVDDQIAWASGTGGTVLRTIDGGTTWTNVSVKAGEEFDFRDVHAHDQDTAIVINAGQPAHFYRTEDGGQSWNQVFEHQDKGSFFDAIVAVTPDHLIAMSDPVDDRILLVESKDRGKTWSELPPERRPKKLVGEAGFAASGSNMIFDPNSGAILLALGGHEEGQESMTSRILVSSDGAKSWSAVEVPMRRNPSSGIFSLICLPDSVCVAVGGNYLKAADDSSNLVAGSIKEGNQMSVPRSRPRGYRSGVTYTVIKERLILIAVGPEGCDISDDRGETWGPLNDEGFHAVKSTPDGVVWASGGDGRIARLRVR